MAMSNMRDFADSIDLQGQAEEGFGKEFKDTLRMGANRGIARAGVRNLEAIGHDAFNRGMENSGAANIKAPAQVRGDMLSQVLQSENSIFERNEQFKLESQQRWLNVLSHEDQMEFNRKQLDANDPDLLDQIGQLSSLASLFI